MLSNHSLITNKEARKLLGPKEGQLSDAQVAQLINELDFIATLAARQYKARQVHNRKEVNHEE